MGKGNFILGTGSSSIGDVTFARRNGQQIARVRVRKIKNPKSYGQAEQRMISAEVVKFYSPLSGVLETSFEGLSKSESYAKFLSINMNLARANEWPSVKGQYHPYPYVISEGSLGYPEYDLTYFDVGEPAQGTAVDNIGALSTLILAKYPQLQTGDQVTIIGWTGDAETGWNVQFARFFLDAESTDALPAGVGYSVKGGVYIGSDEPVALGVIFSRWNGEKWARSNSKVATLIDYMEGWVTPENYAAAVASYMKGAGRTPISNVYLNGHDDE